MKNRTENISVRYRPQHLTKSLNFLVKWNADRYLYFMDKGQDVF